MSDLLTTALLTDQRERLRRAEEHNRARRLLALRKWERREAAAGRRARAARSALH